jgi:hypothetical protein
MARPEGRELRIAIGHQALENWDEQQSGECTARDHDPLAANPVRHPAKDQEEWRAEHECEG